MIQSLKVNVMEHIISKYLFSSTINYKYALTSTTKQNYYYYNGRLQLGDLFPNSDKIEDSIIQIIHKDYDLFCWFMKFKHHYEIEEFEIDGYVYEKREIIWSKILQKVDLQKNIYYKYFEKNKQFLCFFNLRYNLQFPTEMAIELRFEILSQYNSMICDRLYSREMVTRLHKLYNNPDIFDNIYLKITIESEFDFLYNLFINEHQMENFRNWRIAIIEKCFISSLNHMKFLLNKFTKDKTFHFPASKFPYSIRHVNGKSQYHIINHVLETFQIDPNDIILNFWDLKTFKEYWNIYPFEITNKEAILRRYRPSLGNHFQDAAIINQLQIFSKDEASRKLYELTENENTFKDHILPYIENHWYLS